MLGHWPDASISSGSKSKQAGSLQIDLNMIDKINDGVGQIQIRDKLLEERLASPVFA